MRWIGLTGGIASGKSSVAKHLRDEGVAVADADQIAFDMVTKDSPGLQSVIQTFGREFLLAGGHLDRAALGKKIFADPDARLALEGLLHPLIQVRVGEMRALWIAEGRPFAVYDIPLLFEKKLEKNFDSILLVVTDSDQQRTRIMRRNQLTEAEAESRILAQIPLREKIKNSTHVILNHGDLPQLKNLTLDWLAKERVRSGARRKGS